MKASAAFDEPSQEVGETPISTTLGPPTGDSIAARAAGCDTVLSTWPGDGHPDHQAAGIAAQNAASRLRIGSWWYPIWAWHHERIDGDLLRSAERATVAAVDLAAKKRALGAYRSQLTDLLGPPIVPPGFLQHHLRPFEVVVPCP